MLEEISLKELIEIASENYLENTENKDSDMLQKNIENEIDKRVKEQIGIIPKVKRLTRLNQRKKYK